MTDGKGVDIVFDPVGMIAPSLKCVNFNARILVVGFAGGTIENVSCLFSFPLKKAGRPKNGNFTEMSR